LRQRTSPDPYTQEATTTGPAAEDQENQEDQGICLTRMQEKEGMCFFQRDVMAYMIYTLIFKWVRTHSMALAQF
jgi:hypothetical protein